MSYMGRQVGGEYCKQWSDIESTYKVFCRFIGDHLTPATTFPMSDAGLFTTLCPGPPIPSVKTSEKVHLYQEEPA